MLDRNPRRKIQTHAMLASKVTHGWFGAVAGTIGDVRSATAPSPGFGVGSGSVVTLDPPERRLGAHIGIRPDFIVVHNTNQACPRSRLVVRSIILVLRCATTRWSLRRTEFLSYAWERQGNGINSVLRRSLPSRSFLGLGRVRVFRPGVLGITAAQVLADLMIGRPPETGQVVGHLLRAMVGGQSARAPARGDRPPAASPTCRRSPGSARPTPAACPARSAA